MGRFSGMSKVSTGNLYFRGKGGYEVEIGEILFKQNRQRVDSFIIETTVTKSDNPAYPPGCSPSQVISFKHDAAPRNVKAFVAAVMEIADPDAYVPEEAEQLEGRDREDAIDRWWDEAIEFIISKEQPVRGYRMRLETDTVKTEAGGDFTLHRWISVVSKPVAG